MVAKSALHLKNCYGEISTISTTRDGANDSPIEGVISFIEGAKLSWHNYFLAAAAFTIEEDVGC